MGRDRAKTKQTKIARQLKYGSPEMGLKRLQQELIDKSNEFDQDDYYSDREEWTSGAGRDS